MVTSGGGGTPLPCRNSSDGVTRRRETVIPPSARGGCGVRATQPPALGCGGGRVSPMWGSGLRSLHGQRRKRQCQGGIRLIFLAAESPPHTSTQL